MGLGDLRGTGTTVLFLSPPPFNGIGGAALSKQGMGSLIRARVDSRGLWETRLVRTYSEAPCLSALAVEFSTHFLWSYNAAEIERHWCASGDRRDGRRRPGGIQCSARAVPTDDAAGAVPSGQQSPFVRNSLVSRVQTRTKCTTCCRCRLATAQTDCSPGITSFEILMPRMHQNAHRVRAASERPKKSPTFLWWFCILLFACSQSIGG